MQTLAPRCPRPPRGPSGTGPAPYKRAESHGRRLAHDRRCAPPRGHARRPLPPASPDRDGSVQARTPELGIVPRLRPRALRRRAASLRRAGVPPISGLRGLQSGLHSPLVRSVWTRSARRLLLRQPKHLPELHGQAHGKRGSVPGRSSRPGRSGETVRADAALRASQARRVQGRRAHRGRPHLRRRGLRDLPRARKARRDRGRPVRLDQFRPTLRRQSEPPRPLPLAPARRRVRPRRAGSARVPSGRGADRRGPGRDHRSYGEPLGCLAAQARPPRRLAARSTLERAARADGTRRLRGHRHGARQRDDDAT